MVELVGSLGGDVLGLAEAGVLRAVEVWELDPLRERFQVWTTDLLRASRTFLLLDDRDGNTGTMRRTSKHALLRKVRLKRVFLQYGQRCWRVLNTGCQHVVLVED